MRSLAHRRQYTGDEPSVWGSDVVLGRRRDDWRCRNMKPTGFDSWVAVVRLPILLP